MRHRNRSLIIPFVPYCQAGLANRTTPATEPLQPRTRRRSTPPIDEADPIPATWRPDRPRLKPARPELEQPAPEVPAAARLPFADSVDPWLSTSLLRFLPRQQ